MADSTAAHAATRRARRSSATAGSSRTAAACLLLCSMLLVPVAQAAHAGARLKPASSAKQERPKVTAFVGVQTAFDYGYRRSALRETWFPHDQNALDRFQDETGVVVRFVIGHTRDEIKTEELHREIEAHGGFLRLPMLESYSSLTLKTYLYFKMVMFSYEVDYILKIDDDVYLQLPRVPAVVQQWKETGKDYVGCFFQQSPVIANPQTQYPKWFEPQHMLFPGSYLTYARGSLYALSYQALTWIMSVPRAGLRFFRSEDVTVGMWMAAFNATHYEDRRLCSEECYGSSIAVYNHTCTGLCNVPEQLRALHVEEECVRGPDLDMATNQIPMWGPMITFAKLTETGGEMHPPQRRRQLAEEELLPLTHAEIEEALAW